MVSDTTFPERRASLRAVSRPSQLAFAVALLAVASGCFTYALLTDLLPYHPGRVGQIALVLFNLTLVLTLAALIGWRIARLMATRRSGRAGAKLHVRLVTWFSVIAVVPVILVAVFAAVTLNLGLDQMFSGRVKEALGSAVNVAQVYVKEHEASILGDIAYISDAIQRDPQLFDEEHHVRAGLLFAKLGTITQNRGLQASYILDSKGSVLGSTKQKSLKDPPIPSAADFAQAREGVVVDTPENGTVTALVQLQALNDAYLETVRVVDPKVFAYYLRTRAAVTEYNRLNASRLETQLQFAALYAMVALVVLLAAIWSGLWAANRLVQPISNLIDAAGRVSEGDLDAQVHVERARKSAHVTREFFLQVRKRAREAVQLVHRGVARVTAGIIVFGPASPRGIVVPQTMALIRKIRVQSREPRLLQRLAVDERRKPGANRHGP